MREEHIRHLCCPSCQGSLTLGDGARMNEGRVERGELSCRLCGASYPIVGFIPRFVPDEGYLEGFGLEWNVHDRTQYDAHTGVSLSERRFFEETGWPRRMDGELVIEAGSGSGRFTEHALATGATVLSLDYSRAVEANYRSNGDRDNLLLVQGDLFRMPFPHLYADRIFCFGVLQHTPDPRAALASLERHVKPGGELVADIYAKTFPRYVLGTKYWVRPLTRRMPSQKLHRLTARYVDVMWPVARLVRRIPRIGRQLNWRLLIGDYSDVLQDDPTLLEWAKLDTFDMLAPRYDKPARAKTVSRWCEELDFEAVTIKPGYNGLEIHARRPSVEGLDGVADARRL